jgi:hypothetical protein
MADVVPTLELSTEPTISKHLLKPVVLLAQLSKETSRPEVALLLDVSALDALDTWTNLQVAQPRSLADPRLEPRLPFTK